MNTPDLPVDPADRVVMRALLEEHPTLTSEGIGRQLAWLSPAERAQAFQRNRADILSDYSMKQFAIARRWWRQAPRQKSISTYGSSYGLKHAVEDEIGHTYNGVFIAAALAEGFRMKPVGDGPNARFDVARSAWRPAEERQRERSASVSVITGLLP